MGVTYASQTALESMFVKSGLSGDAVAATANGTAIDRETVDKLPGGPYQDAILLVEVEAINGAPSAISVTLRVEESDDNSTFTAVTDPANVSAPTINFTAVGFKYLAVRINALKRYKRAAISAITLTGGSSPSVKLRATWILTEGRQV